MLVVGIDQSYTSTGLVALKDKQISQALVITSDKTHNDFARAKFIRDQITKQLNHIKPDLVVLEQLAFSSFGDATRKLAGLQYAIALDLIDNSIPFEVIAPTQLKKFAFGSGKASKQEMFNALPDQAKTQLSAIANKTHGLYDLTDAYFLALTQFKE